MPRENESRARVPGSCAAPPRGSERVKGVVSVVTPLNALSPERAWTDDGDELALGIRASGLQEAGQTGYATGLLLLYLPVRVLTARSDPWHARLSWSRCFYHPWT